MEWEEIDDLLNKSIQNKDSLENGYKAIQECLRSKDLDSPVINLNELQSEFSIWLKEVITTEPIPKDIKSIYFGLTTMSFPDIDNWKEKTTIYISGSPLPPNEDEDWACETDYFPERRYLLLDDFEKIDQLIKEKGYTSGEYEVLLFNGILNLLVINSIDEFKKEFLTYKEK